MTTTTPEALAASVHSRNQAGDAVETAARKHHVRADEPEGTGPTATIGHWNEQGVMPEEFLFLDHGEFMMQIGLGQ